MGTGRATPVLLLVFVMALGREPVLEPVEPVEPVVPLGRLTVLPPVVERVGRFELKLPVSSEPEPA
jgi:hypothetical protein